MSETAEPYVGPRPFDKEDATVFFGRDDEAAELLSLVIAHPAVLLYSQSGAGKTSLLNAQLIPMLEKRGARVLGPGRVGGHASKQLVDTVRNVYLANLTLTLQRTIAPDLTEFAPTTFGALVDGLLPKVEVSDREQEPLRVIVLDQVEEIFTAFPERWVERAAFLDQIGEALEGSFRLRVVLALREEYLAAMDPYVSVFPGRLRSRFRLERLRRPNALKAITGPLVKTERGFASGAAEKLVDNLLQVPTSAGDASLPPSGEFIEPLHLQVVCQSLWRSLPAEVKSIDEARIAAYGDVDRALLTYYEDCLRDVLSGTTVTETAVRAWFETRLITPVGTRAIVYKDNSSTAGMPNPVVERLEQLRLVRAELRGSAVWYELTHDRLIGPIRSANRQWQQQRGAGSALYDFLIKRTETWTAKKHDVDLLTALQLEAAENWLRTDGAPFADDPQVQQFLQASRIRATRERTKVLRRTLAAAVALMLIAAASAVLAFMARADERKARTEAEDATMQVQGEIASQYALQPGKEFDALVFGLKAVHPRVTQGRNPPPAAETGLRDALKAVGPGLSLRGSPVAESPLRGAPPPVTHLEFSPDGKRVVTCAADGIRMWNSESGEHLFFIPRPPKKESQGRSSFRDDLVAWLPSGDRLVWQIPVDSVGDRSEGRSGSSEPNWQFLFLDASSGRRLADWEAMFRDTVYVSIPRTGDRFASVPVRTNEIQIRRVDTGRVDRVIRLADSLLSLEFSDDGGRLVTETEKGELSIWDTATGTRHVRVMPLAKRFSASAMTLSPGGRHLIVWDVFGEETGIIVFDVAEKRIRRIQQKVTAVAVLPDSKVILSSDSALEMWDLATLRRIVQYSHWGSDMHVVGSEIVYRSPRPEEGLGDIKALNISSGRERQVLSDIPSLAYPISATRDGRLLGLILGAGRAKVVNMTSAPNGRAGDVRAAFAEGCRIIKLQPEWVQAKPLCENTKVEAARR